MCHVCESEGLNWKFLNGPDKTLETAWLFGIYRGRIAKLRLCYIHSVELFMFGEHIFLEHHYKLCHELTYDQPRFLSAA